MALVLVTGASAGFGAATARAFAREGWQVAIGARREDRLQDLAPELEKAGAPAVFVHTLDVTSRDSIAAYHDALLASLGVPDTLVNNAGLARGTERIEDADGVAWREMVETNLLGSLWVTRAFLPSMLERGSGHVICVGSVAGHMGYVGGSVYCASKAGLRRACEALRLETLGRGIRVSSVDPGAAETEFSIVRYSGDEIAAKKVYDGFEPLRADDVAECILFAATRPPHVNIDEIRVMATAQADPWHLARRGDGSA